MYDKFYFLSHRLINTTVIKFIYWEPLIWLVKNGQLIVLTCISFFNELRFVLMRGGDTHGRTGTIGNYLHFT